ncbi:O-succinylbenzoate synthase [Halalkaliarchaeum desulfuricum]|uniref:o-succinylbenzoate synthase n=1 Tax=Halalkaliarchaeum desulfuricum TaxID=2055893 RepID=A0A343TJW5_9EURY|nr:o-succinylbenzoate synthase [Halalkaliarchaeum desulfuricum]AUX09387.1 O-succinylbenzoate synthase [Halalkaliarchaeum desulfuricum]
MRIRPFSVPLVAPLSTARGEISQRRGFLVGIGGGGEDNDASKAEPTVQGIGEATPLPGWTEPYGRCRKELEAFAAASGDAASAVDPPEAPAARHGVALARLDRDARTANASLAERLSNRHGTGAAPADTVPVNATVGDGSPAETAASCREAVDVGFDCLKVKVGNRALSGDLERLRAVRDAVGEAVTLRADANGAWSRGTAERAIEQFGAFGVDYVEQPLPADDLEGHAHLRSRGVGIALDESLAVRGDGETSPLDRVRRAIEAEAADVVVLKPMALGGPDLTVEAATAAREAGVEPVITTTIDAVVARTAAVHVAAAIPDVSACGLATGGLLAEDLAPDPAPAEGGRIRVPDGPGIADGAFDGLCDGTDGG